MSVQIFHEFMWLNVDRGTLFAAGVDAAENGGMSLNKGGGRDRLCFVTDLRQV
jgi:hypothetical protein